MTEELKKSLATLLKYAVWTAIGAFVTVLFDPETVKKLPLPVIWIPVIAAVGKALATLIETRRRSR